MNYILSKKIQNQIEIVLQSKNFNLIVYGPAGIGKTSLIKYIENKKKVNFVKFNGPLLRTKADFFSFLSIIKDGDYVFIDEVHSITSTFQELLYSLIDKESLKVNIGTRINTDYIEFKINDVKLVCSTTNLEKLSTSFKTRFEHRVNLNSYTMNELKNIVIKNSKFHFTDKEVEKIIEHSKYNPREIRNSIELIERNRNYLNIILKAPEFNEIQINYLTLLYEKNYSLSIKSISSMLNYSEEFIRIEVEPILLKKDLVIITKSGRILSKKGTTIIKKHL